MKIIIRADDLGYSEAVNYGIEKSVKHGIIKNVGFMVNMDASKHGIDLLKDVDVCLGQHTNICVGKPICDPSLIPSITNGKGEFKSSREYREAKEDFVDLDEVIMEIEAQYQRYKELVGREPEYFEGHAVASDNFLKGLEIVAKHHGLKYSGFDFGDESIIMVNDKKVYLWMDSTTNPNYDPFITLKKMVKNAHEDAYDMLVFHPGYLDDYILKHSSLTIPRTLEVEASCSKEVKDWLKENNIKLYTYNDI
ncbi:putative glycoside hydrolase/deacetylase ChbG (UPF0249 family) [Breznakia sp. PF5-3]|uniref:ChbG/HpnK family deacetylase n=1 Tax=unclassified Breznakia TaxID=2623764 RepID=UPI00240718BA|nr:MULTISPECIES: ChbG/HpnK family deacetylase [unclassified Breznakia]MDF9823972.1 putative glycoside hydrolase/deacetylase ChbG (UPF0249 family) [Breznakia sp. PM6-1]MDF9834771.1 putative glycoside hydrolase/deacetylase ChbG (UPF0249 family) [Breznakia sp. PF5-3]MDF9838379.1 putative glycoside hydrolase/deacetylase ChbG (UPF0249 family) [Breznakia sp. PFB2-8]MDF9860395.1 putative glycoside hydrolase/deacetylase ChbG (UPF0249 family) [Breznakia sp. PH5-24]